MFDLHLSAGRDLEAAQEHQRVALAQSDRALELATTLDLREAYLSASPLVRRYLNQAVFDRLLLDDLGGQLSRTRVGHGKVHDIRVTQAILYTEVNIQRLAQAILAVSLSAT